MCSGQREPFYGIGTTEGYNRNAKFIQWVYNVQKWNSPKYDMLPNLNPVSFVTKEIERTEEHKPSVKKKYRTIVIS